MQPQRAVVISTANYRLVVKTEAGETLDVTGPGSQHSPVGTKGTVSYVSGRTYGLWVFRADQDPT